MSEPCEKEPKKKKTQSQEKKCRRKLLPQIKGQQQINRFFRAQAKKLLLILTVLWECCLSIFFLYVAIYLYLLYDLMILVILRYYFRLRNLILILMDSAIMPIKLYIYQKFVCFFFISVYIITSNRFFCFYKKNCLMLNL